MVDPLSVLAGVVTTIILPKALEKVGEKVGETAWDKSGETIQAVRQTVQAKLQTAGTGGLLARAETNPTEANTQVLQAELVSQMESDQDFAEQLQVLINQIQSQSPTVQVILDELRVRGNFKIVLMLLLITSINIKAIVIINNFIFLISTISYYA